MFTTIIVQPIFNLLVLIYALIPGHNFGLAIILFTVLVRLILYPLLRKQLRHARAMRSLAPELKRIKQSAGGDRRKESMMTMELYKEREINPFSSLGIVIIQIPILIGLYVGLQKIIKDPHAIVNFSYGFMHHLGWLQTLSHDIGRFDNTLFGFIDLGKTPTGHGHGVYWPALILAALSAAMQYYQSKMLMPKPEDGRTLKSILKEAGQGKQADQSEVSAAVGRGTLILIPAFIFLISLNLPAAVGLYWLTSSLVAYIQQRHILKEDVNDARAVVTKVTTRTIGEDEVANDTKTKPKTKTAKPRKTTKKRRRK